MAKATAVCTCATCGETWTVTTIRANRRDAESWEEWMAENADECPNCREARIQRERDEANAKAAASAKEAGLPELTGTEKQVAWATTLREKALVELRKLWVPDETPENKTKYEAFLAWVASAHTKASWWIDHKYMDTATINSLVKTWMESEPTATEMPEETALREAAEAEMTVAPRERTHGGAVEITVTEAAVSAGYERDDDFRALVKGLGYQWDTDRRVWSKEISFMTGPAPERAAELGNHLLNAGFAVQIADPDTRTAAIEGRYHPEHRRWITSYTGDGPRKGWFCIRLVCGEDMYDKVRAIRGSQYVKPNVAVPAKRWRELLDFAELYDYRLSPGTKKIIAEQEAAIITADPAGVKTAVYREHAPEDTLASGAGVLEDLLDDDD